MLSLALALVIQAAPGAAPPAARFDLNRSSVAALRDSLEAAQLRFFSEWSDAFKLTQGYDSPMDDVRWSVANCNVWNDRHFENIDSARWTGRIKSSYSLFSICPSWALGGPPPHEERFSHDNALDARFRQPIRGARESLIAIFAAARGAAPTDSWIVAQHIRLLVDQRSLDRALAAASDCRANASWCGMLRGFVLAELGRDGSADSQFVATLAAMSPAQRCSWIDVGSLLEPAPRQQFRKGTCTERESFDARLWWLGDPLWSDTHNARRSEHYARRVSNALRTALTRDERWNWHDRQGGDALKELVERYGWPSYTHWWGSQRDRAQTGRYLLPAYRGAVNPPYTTFEYSTGRIETIPAARAIENPFAATRDDWTIVAPGVSPLKPPRDTSIGRVHFGRWLEEEAMSQLRGWWWPRSHFPINAVLEQLPDAEMAFLRRQTAAVISTVFTMPDTLNRRSADATVLTSTGPDAFEEIFRGRATVERSLALHGSIAAQPALFAVELSDSSAGGLPWHARTRYAIAPPKPLADMARGMTALSDLILVGVPASGELATTPDALLPTAISKALRAGTSRFGLYWETYGIGVTDSVEIAVWVERYTTQGILRRFGIALNVARDLNTPVAMAWTEHGRNPRAHVIAGPVPIVGRNVVVELGTLAPGDYWLDVAVRRPGQEPVRSRRTFTVLAR